MIAPKISGSMGFNPSDMNEREPAFFRAP